MLPSSSQLPCQQDDNRFDLSEQSCAERSESAWLLFIAGKRNYGRVKDDNLGTWRVFAKANEEPFAFNSPWDDLPEVEPFSQEETKLTKLNLFFFMGLQQRAGSNGQPLLLKVKSKIRTLEAKGTLFFLSSEKWQKFFGLWNTTEEKVGKKHF